MITYMPYPATVIEISEHTKNTMNGVTFSDLLMDKAMTNMILLFVVLSLLIFPAVRATFRAEHK